MKASSFHENSLFNPVDLLIPSTDLNDDRITQFMRVPPLVHRVQTAVFRGNSVPDTRFLFLIPQVQSGISDFPSALPNGVMEYSTRGGTSL
jgi:hypothetical protein